MIKRTQKSVSGTSFHDHTFKASPSLLKVTFGLPVMEENDGSDKVNMEWELELEDGTVFTIYDWKEYKKLKPNTQYEWHVGGFSEEDTKRALAEIHRYIARN